MFVDKVKVDIQAGHGGNGKINFRHEKFIDKGGPDGGDGGHGGSVVFEASWSQNTLATFRFQKLIKAEDGQDGGKRKRHGKTGADKVVAVPVGTSVSSLEGEVLADLTEAGRQVTVAKGGRGGFGNAHFTSSVRQTPRLAEKGEKGDAFEAILELKMIADVGLVGLPNAGKSTLLASISNAKPEIANYPFTTLRPNLGVVDLDANNSLLVADIPGLIEGASEGKGLGDDFLRHVERTNVLVHLVDVYQDDVVEAYKTIQNELASYKVNLTKRPQVIVLNKVDGVDQEVVDAKSKQLSTVAPKGTQLFAISAQSHQGTRELLYALNDIANKQRAVAAEERKADLPIITLKEDSGWKVTQTKKGFLVTGQKIERFADRTDFDNFHAVERLRDIMKKMGIMKELIKQGAQPGQDIKIGEHRSIQY